MSTSYFIHFIIVDNACIRVPIFTVTVTRRVSSRITCYCERLYCNVHVGELVVMHSIHEVKPVSPKPIASTGNSRPYGLADKCNKKAAR